MVNIIAFDADDTLWENELYFHQTREELVSLLNCFASEKEILQLFESIERNNLEYYGYGVKSHTLSMMETALEISNNTISPAILAQLLEVGKDIFKRPLKIFDGVEDTLKSLSVDYKLIVITKGDLKDQNRKLEESGLMQYFYRTFVVTEKREDDYLSILEELAYSPNDFLMVGNSLPSDIIPVLNIGGYGVYIPHNYTCHYERTESNMKDNRLIQLNKISELKELPKLIQNVPA